MAIQISQLANVDTLTVELSLILIGIIASFLFASIRLRSAISIFTWMIMVIILMFIFLTNLEFIWFWMGVILNSIALFTALTVWVFFSKRY